MTPAYEQWLLHRPPIQPSTPSASTSSNKRQCTESTSSSRIEHSHTQADYKQTLSDLAEEWVAHARTKATLAAKVLLRIEADVSRECTQH